MDRMGTVAGTVCVTICSAAFFFLAGGVLIRDYMAHVVESHLSDSVVWKVKFLLADDIGSDSVERELAVFVQSIYSHYMLAPTERILLTQALEVLSEAAHYHHIIATVLCEHFKECSCPGPFLDLVPTVFSKLDSTVILDVSTTLLNFDDDMSQFVKVLDSILSLPMDKQLGIVVDRAVKSSITLSAPAVDEGLLALSMNPHFRAHADLPHLWQTRVRMFQ
jgi:hypothetical protein